MRIEEKLKVKSIPTTDGNIDIDAWADSLGYAIRDGQLMDGNNCRAVAVSPGYGAGWSTWNGLSPLDPVSNLILLTLKDKNDDNEFRELYEYIEGRGSTKERYLSMEDVVIEWVSADVQFRVTEYDGHESIEYRYEQHWM